MKNKIFYQCVECGSKSSSWFGKCSDCGSWNSLEKIEETARSTNRLSQKAEIVSLSKVKAVATGRLETGVYEFDRVLGGGFVPGEVVLLTGEPGVGKSTLLLEVLQKLKVLYISGEESATQIKHRADRLKVNLDSFYFSSNTEVEAIIGAISNTDVKVDLVVIDSIQMIYSNMIPSTPGGTVQIKEVVGQLVDFAKNKNIPVILIGHITKEGSIAGPKTLEHLVDAVAYLEGEKFSGFRILRCSKNRFGSTDEIGVFEMGESGLKQVDSPTQFLEKNDSKLVGKAIVGVTEGSRSIFFEIQSLVVPSFLPSPRRVVSGLDYNKVLLILAVLQKYLRLPLERYDIYISVAGGVSTKSTASDLGVAASVLSSIKNLSLPDNSVFIGEISLLGEVRQVFQQKRLIKDATRYGFKPILSSEVISNVLNITGLLK